MTVLDFPRRDLRRKLDWPEVRVIRRLYAEGATLVSLAQAYDLTCPQIHNIVRARHWRNDPEHGPIPPAPLRKPRKQKAAS